MARSIEQINNEIIKAKESEPALAGLTSTSKVAIWRLWAYITAFVIYTLEQIFDQHKAEVLDALTQLKPHTARWYRPITNCSTRPTPPSTCRPPKPGRTGKAG